nr:hypothetical protein [Abalone asfa-like virus]
MDETLLKHQYRPTLLPLQDKQTWMLYKTLESMIWNAQEVSMQDDFRDWSKKLTKGQRTYYRLILAFFYCADELVLANIDHFMSLIQDLEVRYFYSAQAMQECVHSEAYSLQVLSIFDYDEIQELQEIIKTLPVINKMVDWVVDKTDYNRPLAYKIGAFVIVESLFFQSHFISIQELKQQNVMCGLTHYNELISRDENQHCLFGIHLLNNKIDNKLPEKDFHEMMESAVLLLDEFITYAFDKAREAEGSENHNIIGLSEKLLQDYIRFFADDINVKLGYKKIYFIKNNPFPSSVLLGMNKTAKTNFFEQRPTQYQQVSDMTFGLPDM